MKLQESEDSFHQQSMLLNEENNNLKKLVNLYKSNFEETTAKIDELERRNEQQAMNFKSFQSSKQSEVDTIITEAKQTWKLEKEELLKKLEDLENQLKTSVSNNAVSSSSSSSSSMITFQGKPYETIPPAFSPDLSMTDLYDQFVRAQKALILEQSKRNEIEVYLNQILKDIEMKAPLIAKQKKDYNRIISSHSQLMETLDRFVDENNRLKVTLTDYDQQMNSFQKEIQLLSFTNNDLTSQIQHLLKSSLMNEEGRGVGGRRTGYVPSGEEELGSERRGIAVIDSEDRMEEEERRGFFSSSVDEAAFAGSNRGPQEIISQHLVLYNNVEELQEKNVQLLSTIRRLTMEREQQEAILSSLNNKNGGGNASDASSSTPVSSSLFALQAELNELKADQNKQEEMIKVLIQQRDMYRSMLTTGDYHNNSSFAALSSTSQQGGDQGKGSSGGSSSSGMFLLTNSPANKGNRDAAMRETNDNNEMELITLRSKYASLSIESEKLKERLLRFEENDKQLNEEFTKTKEETMNLKLSLSSLKTECRFLTEAKERFENTIRILQKENTDSLKRKDEYEENLISYQRELRNKDDLLHSYLNEGRAVKEALKQKEIENEIFKNTEKRLLQQISELKEENNRNSVLTEHLHRIETSLSSRAEEEKELYRTERDSIKAQYDSYRQSIEEKIINDESKLKLQENELKNIINKLENKEKAFLSLQESFRNEENLNKLNHEKINTLERSLR
jgi:nucleoprotein TPR